MNEMTIRRGALSLAAGLSLGLALLLTGCDTDSPTAPQHQGLATTPVPTGSWTITISVNPSPIPVDGVNPTTATVRVTVQRVGNAQPPPNGSTVTLSTSYGTFVSGGNVTAMALELTSGTGAASLTVPGTQTGSLVLQAQIESSIAQLTVLLVQGEAPEETTLFIESISPRTGSPLGGERVRINGTGFEEPVRVSFGGVMAQEVVSVTSTRIVVKTPQVDLAVGQTSTVDVTVTINVNQGSQDQDTLAGAFTFTRGDGGGGGGGGALVPRIISFTPTSGPNEGGTEVTIFGEGFSNQVQVFFGDEVKIEAELLDVSPTRLVVMSPAATGFNSINANAAVTIVVRNVQSGLEARSDNPFHYGRSGASSPVQLTAISQTEGFYTGGDVVTVYGVGFVDPVAVGFAEFAQHVISVTGTEIVVRTAAVDIACSDVSGEVQVTNIETGESGTGLGWIYKPIEVTIFYLDPSSTTVNARTGVPVPGAVTQLTIHGTGFDPPLRVTFAEDVRTSVVGVSADGTQVTVAIPPFGGEWETETCDDDGDGNDGERYLPVRVDVQVENLNTTCSDDFSNGFTYYPSDTSCRNDAAPPEPPEEPEAPSASFVVTSMVGNTVNFLSTSTGDPPLVHAWWFGEGTAGPAPESTSPSPSYTYPGPGTYTVTLRVTNAGGTSTIQGTVTIP